MKLHSRLMFSQQVLCDALVWHPTSSHQPLNYIKDWVHVVQTGNLHRCAYNRYLRVTAGVDQVKLGTIGKFMSWCKQKI